MQIVQVVGNLFQVGLEIGIVVMRMVLFLFKIFCFAELLGIERMGKLFLEMLVQFVVIDE